MSKIAILSSPIIIGEGAFEATRISHVAALELIKVNGADVFTAHQTIKVLGLEPDTSRRECDGYDHAIVVSPKQRLEFGREYSVAEIRKIGYQILYIVKTGD